MCRLRTLLKKRNSNVLLFRFGIWVWLLTLLIPAVGAYRLRLVRRRTSTVAERWRARDRTAAGVLGKMGMAAEVIGRVTHAEGVKILYKNKKIALK